MNNDRIISKPCFVISIPLNGEKGKGKHTTVDFDRYQEIKQYPLWESNEGYVIISLGQSLKYLLHRYIMGVHEHSEFEVDHIDGDRLNNTRSNLRLVTSQQNGCNRKLRYDSSSLKGVSYIKNTDQYQAQIHNQGKTIFLGLYDSRVEAGRAYDNASRAFRGEFGKTNEDLGLYTKELIERDLRESYQRKRTKIERQLPIIANNTSGYYGLCFNKRANKWQVKYNGKYYGTYFDKLHAIEVVEHLRREETQTNLDALDREYDRKWAELQSN